MKRTLSIIILLLTLALFVSLRYGAGQERERRRLEINQRTLLDEGRRYRVRDSLNAVTVGVLTLRADEFRRHFGELNALIRDMNVKLRRVESASQNALESRYEISARVRDTVIARPAPADPTPVAVGGTPASVVLGGTPAPGAVPTSSFPPARPVPTASTASTASTAPTAVPPPVSAHAISYSDAYITLDGVVVDSVFRGTVVTYDTLTQIVHRVPRRLWFIRWGTRELRQEIVSSNPHTRITYSRSIRLTK